MGKLTPAELLRQALRAGLKVYTDGDKLVCEGPQQLEPIARAVLARKPEVYPLVKATTAFVPADRRTRSLHETEHTPNILVDEDPLTFDAAHEGPWARRAAALLATVHESALRSDLRFLFEERSAIAEFEGNANRNEAERLAFALLETSMRRAGLLK